eukprot:TRINITY_DN18907_c0_g1_i1.p1 TRINITY_DN18907_c0_g1~~TRINITY_DN18907_c0_g1_i1.p1  ORF type:complete len:404 (+),score=39.84 TRINITY_DN18907_c0_g1_i1:89-1300(+)
MTFSPLAFVGGTAMLSAVEVMGKVADMITLVVPVSDDGGSSGKIVRLIGGPAVGDCRSAISRLGSAAGKAPAPLGKLLGYRLSQDVKVAALEWLDILQGSHPIWKDIPNQFQIIVTRFLLSFNNSIMKRSSSPFTFSNGSLGNFFLTGARIYFGSLDSGLFLLSRLWHLPYGFMVLPCLEHDRSLTLGIEFMDEGMDDIIGQSNISHPGTETVDKSGSGGEALPGKISRSFYVDTVTGEEVVPQPHPGILKSLESGLHTMLIYGRGSLVTSIVPCLHFREVTLAIQRLNIPKILITNGGPDRETSYCTPEGIHVMSCLEVVTFFLTQLEIPLKDYKSYFTHVVVPSVGGLVVGSDFAEAFPDLEILTVEAKLNPNGSSHYDDTKLVSQLQKLNTDTRFLKSRY